MKGKVGTIIIVVIALLGGILVGQRIGKRGTVLKSGKTLEVKLTEISQELAELEGMAKPGSKGALQEGKLYSFNLDKVPVLGEAKAKVKIVLWSDFQCPFCERMEKMLEEIVRANPDKYALYFKNKVVHDTAALEHEAGISATAQGKFWELNNLFFQNRAQMLQVAGEGPDKLQAKIMEFAAQVGMDVDKLKADLDSHKNQAQLKAEDIEAGANQIMSTPSVFINGYFYGYDPAVLKTKIIEASEKPAVAQGEAKPKTVGIEATLTEIETKIQNLKDNLKRPRGGGGGGAGGEGPKGPEQGKEYPFDLGSAPVLGPKDAKVKVVIFSDFQCPYCEKMAGLMEEVQGNSPNQVAIYFKNFVVHEKAIVEHDAAMAANAQGKFWEYHNLVFKNRMELTKLGGEGDTQLRQKLIDLAKEAKLNVNQFTKDLDSHAYQSVIKDNIAEGRKAGVSGTPSVFINGYFYGYNPADIKAKIEEESKK